MTPTLATIRFVNENRQMLRDIMEHGDPALRPIAAAFLKCVPPKDPEDPKIWKEVRKDA